MSVTEKKKGKKKDSRKSGGGYHEVPGGKKDVFIKRGEPMTTSKKYDDPTKVAGAIAGWIGRHKPDPKTGKYGPDSKPDKATAKKMDAAGKKALAKSRKGKKKGKKESAAEIAGDMIEAAMVGSDPHEVINLLSEKSPAELRKELIAMKKKGKLPGQKKEDEQ